MSAAPRGYPRRRQAGQATVEFSLCVIFLLAVVLGLIDIGRAVLAQWAVSEMAWAGSRSASLAVYNSSRPPDSVTPGGAGGSSMAGADLSQSAMAAARAAAFLIDPSAPTVTVEFPDGDQLPGNRVRVFVSYRFEPISAQFIGGRPLQLSSGNTLRIMR